MLSRKRNIMAPSENYVVFVMRIGPEKEYIVVGDMAKNCIFIAHEKDPD